MTRRFVREGDGMRATFSEPELDLLRELLPEQLRDVYQADDADDPARGRLFPRAYLDPTEERAEEEWRALVEPELLRERLDALARVVDALGRTEQAKRGASVVRLGPGDVPALLGVLNDTRLALGTVLGVTEDTDLADLDPADPATQKYLIYVWLSHVEEELVDTLLGEMPD